MKIIVGAKALQLEELFFAAHFPQQAQIIVDQAIEFGQPAKGGCPVSTFTGEPITKMNEAQLRAALLVKLVQILRLKKNATKASVQFLVSVLNEEKYQAVLNGFRGGFYEWLNFLCEDYGIAFTDKEMFILKAPVQVHQAVLALEVYSLQENLGFIDGVMVMAAENMRCHEDCLSEYALTMGKQSQGISQFRTNVTAFKQGSKLIGTNSKAEITKLVHESTLAHSMLHDKIIQTKQFIMQDLNADYSALFQEKKYKELMTMAEQSQAMLVDSIKAQSKSLEAAISRVFILSHHRMQSQNIDLTGKGIVDFSADGFDPCFAVGMKLQVFLDFESQAIVDLFAAEEAKLKVKADAAKAAEEEQAKAAEAQAEEGKVQKGPQRGGKKKGKEIVTSLTLGRGTRMIFEYIRDNCEAKLHVTFNSELALTLSEVLQSGNQERRLPKCAKGTRDMNPLQMAIRDRAFKIIRGVFKKHGASEIDTPVFELKETLTGKYGEDSKLIYDLQDQGGELLSLRYDLTVPFARYVAENGLSSIKRFMIAKVYRRDQPQMKKGRFREFYQCDFDIAGTYSPMIPDAEVLTVVVDILRSLDMGNFQVKVNNRKLLDAMIEIAGCEKRKFKAICSSIDKLDKEPWSKVCQELEQQKGCTKAQTDKLHEFVQHKGQPWQMMADLKKSGLFDNHQGAQDCLKEMELLFTYIEAAGIIDKVSFDFSLARGLDYYTGIIYEAVFTDTDRVGSISGGGRYDGLVGMFCRDSKTVIPSVGGSIGIERVFAILEEKLMAENAVRATETQVLVAQVGKGLTAERIKICAELWDAGINAETLYNDNPKNQKQMEYALNNGIPLILFIGDQEIADGVVAVKSFNDGQQVMIKRAELAAEVAKLVIKHPVLLNKEDQTVVKEEK